MFLFMLPFIIAIVIFSTIAVREIKNITSLAGDETKKETKPENVVESMGYVLRDNATDLQKEYFKQLKDAIEGESESEVPVEESDIVSLIAKNYVADFYTWTNKAGAYDIGGFTYIYDGEFENSDHYKDNVYLQARDGFYKYMSTYATQYGKENLLEVTDVEVLSCTKMSSPYIINQHVAYKQDEYEEWYDYREDIPYEAYNVSLRWTYKESPSLNLNQFANSINLAIANIDDKYVIVEASETPINGRSPVQPASTEPVSTEGVEG